ncbi:MAG TPA: hypothetical protein VN666_12850 [Nitrospira sp.]|nr:hypothetical protein [Nitrospira sp.]
MASFEREEELVRRLLVRLGIDNAATKDPNADRTETGIDVMVRLADLRTIGVQVTEVDPYTVPGSARAQEKAIAKVALNKPYGMCGQNNPSVVLDAIARVITRKTKIAAKHSFDGYDEVWLLLCGGIPECGALVSTSIMTLLLSAEDLNSATDRLLHNSKYDQCFLLPILAPEKALYQWNRATSWKKHIQPEDISQVPSQTYVDTITKATGARNWQEVKRLAIEEGRKVLTEMRQGLDR